MTDLHGITSQLHASSLQQQGSWFVVWLYLEMGHNCHKVIGNSAGNGGLHDGGEKLEEWAMLVSWP